MTDTIDLLHRQVNPAWIQEGRISSQAFNPTPKDSRLLSVYDGALIDPERAFKHYTSWLGLKSMGTVSVSKVEVASVGLPWRPDTAPFPEHAVIDFSAVDSASKAKAKAQALAARARERGWTYSEQAQNQ